MGDIMTFIPQGYLVVPATSATAESTHYLFGPNRYNGAGCPNCPKPLTQLLSIDTTDLRLGLVNPVFTHLPLLTCWTCGIPQGNLWYRIIGEGSIELISANKGTIPPECWPSPNYPAFFPGTPVQLQALSAEKQWFAKHINHFVEEYAAGCSWIPEADNEYDAYQEFLQQHQDIADWTHQIGGEPRLMNPWYSSSCCICHVPMPYLASIEDDSLTGEKITSDYCQMVCNYCATCHVVCAFVLTT